nr:hypothetical protein CFP56_10043 [Quercus suber]
MRRGDTSSCSLSSSQAISRRPAIQQTPHQGPDRPASSPPSVQADCALCYGIVERRTKDPGDKAMFRSISGNASTVACSQSMSSQAEASSASIAAGTHEGLSAQLARHENDRNSSR